MADTALKFGPEWLRALTSEPHGGGGDGGMGELILASHWSILITWPEYWPLIGQYWSRDPSTCLWLVHFQEACSTPPPWLTWNWRSLDTASVLWLVDMDHVTWILSSNWLIFRQRGDSGSVRQDQRASGRTGQLWNSLRWKMSIPSFHDAGELFVRKKVQAEIETCF